MNTSRFSAGASRFAHFAGLSRNRSRAAEGDDTDDEKGGKRSGRADDGDDDEEKGGKRSGRADDGDDDDKGGKRSGRADDGDDDDKGGKRSGRADDGDDDEKAGKRSGRADDGDEDDEKGGKRSRASDDDDDEDDDEDELNGKGAKAQARRREQARITHILSSPAAANNLALAVSLACETRMSRRQAVKVLKGQSDNRRDDDRRDRESGNRHARRDRQDRNVALGSDAAEPSGKQGVKSSWEATWKKVGVKAG